jgi:SEC-C motif
MKWSRARNTLRDKQCVSWQPTSAPGMLKRMRKRIGGNAQCSCRSGLKFKNCCGKTHPPKFPLRVDASHPVVAGLLAAVDRAKQQQGHSIRVSRVYSPTETFHDYLINNVKWIVGESWYKAQLPPPEVQRHKILRWIKTHDDRARMYSRNDRFRHGDVYSVPPTGDELSLLALAMICWSLSIAAISLAPSCSD